MTKDKVQYGAIQCIEDSRIVKESDSCIKEAIQSAYKTRLNSYSPYSNFKVGAAVVSASSAKIYDGCNVENGSYGATICAERNAILSMIASEGATGIKFVAVVTDSNPPAPPCALCLQVLAEFCNNESEIHLVNTNYVEDKPNAIHEVYKFKDLLPYPFVLN